MVRLDLTLMNGEERNLWVEFEIRSLITVVINGYKLEEESFEPTDIRKVHVAKTTYKLDILNLNRCYNLEQLTFSDDVRIEDISHFSKPLKFYAPINEYILKIILNVGTTIVNLDELIEEKPDVEIRFLYGRHQALNSP